MLNTGRSKIKLLGLLKKASNENNSIEHIITLFRIIHLLSLTDEFTFLASRNYINYFQYHENERMNNVYEYLMQHFKKEISLAKVAGLLIRYVLEMPPNY